LSTSVAEVRIHDIRAGVDVHVMQVLLGMFFTNV